MHGNSSLLSSLGEEKEKAEQPLSFHRRMAPSTGPLLASSHTAELQILGADV